MGKVLYSGKYHTQGLQTASGQWTTDPHVIEDTLWQSRADLWTSAPAAPSTSTHVLQHYFSARPALEARGPARWV